ncbi:MAG: helix-turn-helix transcriptional regulator [Streptomyces sp.]|nr:helix-turn-helix transcriptional regulator [Streptomyces sp.]
MTAAATPAEEGDAFTPVLAEGNQLLATLGLTWDRLVKADAASYATGISEQRVLERLAGAPADHEVPRFCDRLTFLTETRRDERGKRISYRKIAAKAGITTAAVSYLIHGRSEPTQKVAAALERALRVPPGWCSLSEGEALAGYVAPLLRHLRAQVRAVEAWAELSARDVESVSLRTSADIGAAPDLLAELLPTLLESVDEAGLPETGA